MWLVFIPLAIVLLLIALGAAAVVFVAAHAMPGLLILAGVWLLVTAGRRPGHARWARPTPRPRPAPGPTPRQPVQQHPPRPRPEAGPRRELPIDVQIKVEQIRRKADMLLGYADRFPPFSQDLHIVRQTAAEYLPRTVDAYLALPGDGDPVVAATGKTALQELREQLLLLDSKLDDIAQDLQRQDLDRLLANRRFLEERFRLREHPTHIDPPRQDTDAA
ncbi:MAG TPA: hypothetical protein VG370_01440 [Chloroflexota bacterium]|jgi:hypothetical protein|nr:hypothetical protein [Chloroflexota bacterium]